MTDPANSRRSFLNAKLLELEPGLKQLFIDDCFFAERQGIELQVNPPLKAGRVLAPEMPWENGVTGVYTTVLEDNGIYRMWYDAIARTPEEKVSSTPRSLCYATSEDGIHWRREMVNLFDWHGHSKNNIVMPGGSAAVMIDPKAAPESRYKALGYFTATDLWDWQETQGPVSESPDGIMIHVWTSADGIHWKEVDPILWTAGQRG